MAEDGGRMLDDAHLTFVNQIDLLLFEVATLLPTLVKIGLKLREWHYFRQR